MTLRILPPSPPPAGAFADSGSDSGWTGWRAFPDPRAGGFVHAPIGHGVYELRNRATGERILVGRSSNVASHFSTLLPPPFGPATRRMGATRAYILRHLGDLSYRTRACASETAAAREKRRMLRGHDYLFGGGNRS